MSEVSFEQIGGLVMTELRRRLGSPELAAELPGTLLMKVASDYVKHLEKRNEIEMAKLDRDQEDPLEVVLQDGLPFDMRFEILSEFLEEVEAAWQRGSVIMGTMLEEVKDDSDGDVLQDVQGLVPEGGVVPELRSHADVQQGAPDGDPEQPPLRSGGESDEGED